MAADKEWRASSQTPTAPPLRASSSGASNSSGGSLAAAPDAALYADLLRSANGDKHLVAMRLAEMGFQPVDVQPEEQPGSIKAVGTNGGAATWGSLTPNVGSLATKDARKSVGPPRGNRGLDAQAAEAGAPSQFFCPISLQIMRDPVLVAATGQTYDRPCIERWLREGQCSCPATGQELAAPVSLVPNVALRGSIEEWCEKHAPWLLDHNRRVKPIPKDEQFGGMPAPQREQERNPDLAYAIRLQQEELQRLASQRGAVGAAPTAGGMAAFGVQGPPPRLDYSAAPPPGRSASRRSGSRSGSRRGPVRGCLSPTTALLAACTVAYIALFIVGLALNGWNIENLALNPWAGPAAAALMDVGAQDAAAVTQQGQWWRLFSSPWVCGGVIHLLLNMSCLWTFGRYLEGAMRPYSAPSIAALYLLGAFGGSLTSANLNRYYITCGGSAGVCALLGAVWADQLVNHRRYVRQWATALVLVTITAIFVVASLLPLLDPWYQAAGLLAGFLAGLALLAAPLGRRGRRRSACLLFAVPACVLLVVGALAVAATGVGLDSDVGTTSFFKDSCCVGFGNYQCVPATGSPGGCYIQAQEGGTRTLFCPSGASHSLPNGTTIPAGDAALVTQICSQYCTDGASEAPSSGGADSPSSGGTGGGASPSPSGGGGALPTPTPSPASGTSPTVGNSGGSDGLLI